jgi:DNA polymerase-3 subunit delta'
MHSFLLNTPPDIKPGPDVLEIIPETSIGIDEIRQIKTFLSRKPIGSAQNTVIIRNAEKLTLPAQNALLKTLEEPPGNSQVYLVTNHPDQLLPTILSRVQITIKQLSNEIINSQSKDLLSKLLESTGVGERIKILNEAGFTRESFLEFLDNLELILHNDVQNSQLSTLNYQLIADTRSYLKSNVNLKLITTYFASTLR